jgi:hypothetical protein
MEKKTLIGTTLNRFFCIVKAMAIILVFASVPTVDVFHASKNHPLSLNRQVYLLFK